MLLSACVSRPKESPEIRTLVPSEAIDPATGLVNGASPLPDYTKVADADGVHTILALSAGGADGAFGAGVLAGWTARGDRPEFDIITGVSTGALLAVLVFLGPEYDGLIKKLYTTTRDENIFRNRGITGLFSDSLYDNTPLKAQIEEVITAELLAKIAAEHAKGRRLYVATTNLDAGEAVIWNMGEIATGGRTNSLQHFQKVLRASSAVPGFFPPVYIKPQRGVQLRQAHVDGGVKEPILFSEFMAKSPQKDKHLYMVVNGTTRRFNASKPVKANVQDIARKTIAELLRELQHDTIFGHYVRSSNFDVKFHMTSIPDHIPIANDALDFDPVRMGKLYDAGFAIGKAGITAWQSGPPNFTEEDRATMAAALKKF